MHGIFVDINTCTFSYKITVSAIFEYVRGNFLKFLNFDLVNNKILNIDFQLFSVFLQFHVRRQSLPKTSSEHFFCSETLTTENHYTCHSLSGLIRGYEDVQICKKIPLSLQNLKMVTGLFKMLCIARHV